MKTLPTIIALTLTFLSGVLYAQDNIAYQDDAVRFTVITDGVIRLEWQPEGRRTILRCIRKGVS